MKNAKGISKTNGISLRQMATVLFRHKWLILTTFLTTAIATALFAFLMPDTYESRMKILVKNVREDVPVTPEKTDSVSSDKSEVSESEIVSEIELLKSRDLLEQVVQRANLAAGSEAKTVEEAVYKLEKELQVAPVKKSNIIEVRYTSKSPETASSVLKNLSELYLEKHIKLHRPPGTFEFFKAQTEKYEKELRDMESKLSEFQKQADVVTLSQQKELALNKLAEVQARLSDLNGLIQGTTKRIAELEKQLSGMEKRITTQTRTMPNQYSAERLNTMLVELLNRRVQLLAKYQPTDRVVKELDEQIRTTDEAYQKALKNTSVEQATDVNPLRQNLEGELTRAKVEQAGQTTLRDNLSSQVKQYQEILAKLEGATMQHNDLTRQVKQAEDNYQLYAKKAEESRIANALDEQKISNVTIAETPTTPVVPYKRNRPLTLALGLVIGVMLSLGSAITLEFFRDTIHTPRELEAFTGGQVLATIPFQKSLREPLKYKRPARLIEDESKENDLDNQRFESRYFVDFYFGDSQETHYTDN